MTLLETLEAIDVSGFIAWLSISEFEELQEEVKRVYGITVYPRGFKGWQMFRYTPFPEVELKLVCRRGEIDAALAGVGK